MNLFTPDRYAERLVRLALGVEPVDAARGGRVPDGLRVAVEAHPSPIDSWRSWPPGLRLTDALPPMTRHRSGRYVRVHDGTVPAQLTIRLDDPSRRYVPRRLAVTVPAEDDLVAEDSDPGAASSPLQRRTVRPWLHPGAAYHPSPGTTGLRGRIVRAGGAGEPEPVRWARVRARTRTAAPEDIGWAHGDDRGEFLLVLGAPPGSVALLEDPVEVSLSVSARSPAAEPDPADPLLAEVDSLWDLPVEHLAPLTDSADGQQFLPGHTESGPVDVDVAVGRMRALEIPFP